MSAIDLRIVRGTEQTVPPADINIVIDVIRAFTVSHVAFSKGARTIFLVNAVDEAFALKALHPDYLLAGEIAGLPIADFDLDNSPFNVSMADVNGKTLVMKTTHGVTATLAALNAAQIFVTGFSNARQTARHARRLMASKGYRTVNVIASHALDDDDYSCAEYIRDQILDLGQIKPETIMARIRNSRSAKKFQVAEKNGFEPRDLDICTREVKSDFVMEVDKSLPAPRVIKQCLLVETEAMAG
jgi:2-phosphosulfolactate phosphatase